MAPTTVAPPAAEPIPGRFAAVKAIADALLADRTVRYGVITARPSTTGFVSCEGNALRTHRTAWSAAVSFLDGLGRVLGSEKEAHLVAVWAASGRVA